LADGKTHYQQQACPDTASHAEGKRINAPGPAASVDVFRVASGGSYRPDARITMLRGVEESDLRFALQGCIKSVSARAYASVGPRIQSLENQKSNLLTQAGRASNNRANGRKVGALGQVVTQQSVAVLVAAALPRGVGLGK
jgi:hypothetical protein